MTLKWQRTTVTRRFTTYRIFCNNAGVQNCTKKNPHCPQQKCSPKSLDFSDIKVVHKIKAIWRPMRCIYCVSETVSDICCLLLQSVTSRKSITFFLVQEHLKISETPCRLRSRWNQQIQMLIVCQKNAEQETYPSLTDRALAASLTYDSSSSSCSTFKFKIKFPMT